MSKLIDKRKAHAHWLACVGLHLLFPLVPLALEQAITGNISIISLTLSAAMYSISTGISSKNAAIFALSMLVFFFYAGSYGAHMYAVKIGQPAGDFGSLNAGWALFFVFIAHAAERYVHHAMNMNPYLEGVFSRD